MTGELTQEELRDALDAVWARYHRGELTILRANEECAALARASYNASSAHNVRMRRAEQLRAAESVKKAKATRARKKAWREGVERIVAEVRRREAARNGVLTQTWTGWTQDAEPRP